MTRYGVDDVRDPREPSATLGEGDEVCRRSASVGMERPCFTSKGRFDICVRKDRGQPENRTGCVSVHLPRLPVSFRLDASRGS